MKPAASVLVSCLLLAAAGAQQPPVTTAPPAQTLRGQIVAASDLSALPRAWVTVVAGERERISVLADDAGRFTADVPAATGYRVIVRAAGYATTSTAVAAADLARDQTIALARGAAIEGLVLDTSGAPVAGVNVGARLEGPAGGAGDPTPFVSVSDDRGVFRLGGLPAGRYAVRVLNVALEAATAAFSVNLEAGDELTRRDLVVAAAAAQRCSPASAPRSGPAAAGIRGRVTTVAGDPVPCATVAVSWPGRPGRTTTTDAQGRYRIDGLAAGTYALEARRDGYVPRQYGQQRARGSGTPLTLRDGEALDRIDVTLLRGSAITGTVVDDRGELMAGVSVQALQVRSVDGRSLAGRPPGNSGGVTDDRGRFRLFGLLPGAYLVTAAIDDRYGGPTETGYAPVYYPGTTDIAGAAPLRVDAGRDGRADLVFVSMPTARVTGVAVDGEGRPLAGVAMLMTSARSGAILREPRQTQVEPDGRFAFGDVPPGDYVVQAMGAVRRAEPSARPVPQGCLLSFGMRYLEVTNASPPPLTVTALPSSTLEGRLLLDGPDGARPRVSLAALPTDWDRSPLLGSGPCGFTPLEDGRFSLAGLSGSRRIVLSGTPEDWYLQSVVVEGQDATDAPFDFGLEGTTFRNAVVTVSSAGASVRGLAIDERGDPAGGSAVVVFPPDRTLWFVGSRHVKSTRADRDGAFRVGGLPPGSYHVTAVDGTDGPGAGEWLDPRSIERLARDARRVDLAEGAEATVTLRPIQR